MSAAFTTEEALARINRLIEERLTSGREDGDPVGPMTASLARRLAQIACNAELWPSDIDITEEGHLSLRWRVPHAEVAAICTERERLVLLMSDGAGNMLCWLCPAGPGSLCDVVALARCFCYRRSAED